MRLLHLYQLHPAGSTSLGFISQSRDASAAALPCCTIPWRRCARAKRFEVPRARDCVHFECRDVGFTRVFAFYSRIINFHALAHTPLRACAAERALPRACAAPCNALSARGHHILTTLKNWRENDWTRCRDLSPKCNRDAAASQAWCADAHSNPRPHPCN